MKLESSELWTQGAQQFQQQMGDGWKNLFQSFQNMDMGGLPKGIAGMPDLPQVQFSPAKLEALQQQYLKDATELWNQGLQGKAVIKDRRFAV